MYDEKIEAAELGKKGEMLVENFLRDKGYAIIKRNWHSGRFGEIDIIAESDKAMVFVEVKTRTEGAIVSGVEAINAAKIKKLRNAALMFTKLIRTELPLRIDVADVVVSAGEDGKRKWKLKYYINALV